MKHLIIVILATIFMLVIPVATKPIHDGIGTNKESKTLIEPLEKITSNEKPVEPIQTAKPSTTPVVVQKPVETPVNASGGKYDWLRASGIPESDWKYVDYIISRESGWNPCKYNPGQENCSLTAQQVNATQRSGAVACGLGQSLPCGKWGANWTDPVGQLRGAHGYAIDRYGSWANAHSFWTRSHWW